jgi:hypothetical protein
MEAAETKENREFRAFTFGLLGLLAGGFLAYHGIQKFDLSDWPKFARFSSIFATGIAGAVAGAMLAEFIWWIFVLSICIGILYGICGLIWALV